jgi:CHAT domain-containing protein
LHQKNAAFFAISAPGETPAVGEVEPSSAAGLPSHWKVSDKATSQLMTEFIQRWRGGKPRGQAWREAQLQLLHSTQFANPYFWAAFTLTGQWN